MTKHNPQMTSNGPFGMTFAEDEVASIDMSPDDLARRLDQGFTVRSPGKPKPRVTGVVRKPSMVIAKKTANPPRAGFGASVAKKVPAKKGPPPVKRPPAKKGPPVRRPPAKKAPPMRAHNSTDPLFNVPLVNPQRLAKQELAAKVASSMRVPAHLRSQFLAKLKDNHDRLSEFLLLNIATFELAVPTAMETLHNYLSDSTGTATQAELGRVEGMINRMSEMRTLTFMCELCGMSKEQIDLLMGDLFAPELKRPEDPLKHIAKALLEKQNSPQRQPAGKKPARKVTDEEGKSRFDRLVRQSFAGRDTP